MKMFIAYCFCGFIFATTAAIGSETVTEQTVIVQRDSKLNFFSVISDPAAVEIMRQNYPGGIKTGSVERKLFCEKNFGPFTNFIPGECKEKNK